MLGNKEPNPPHIYLKKLLVREVLTLHQSSQTKGNQNRIKKMYTNPLKEGLKTHLASTTSIVSGISNYHYLIKMRLESHSFSNHYQGLETQSRSN